MNLAEFANRHLDVKSRLGDEWLCCCPFHDDSNPSMSLNIRRGLFICYGCGAKGRVDTIAQQLRVSLGDTGVQLDEVKAKLASILKPVASATTSVSAASVDHWHQAPGRDAAWAERNITDKHVIEIFDLGLDVLLDALVIPVHHHSSRRVESVVRRLRHPEPGGLRYRYERGFKISQVLFGSWQARLANPKTVAIVEGSIDALSMWQAGIPAVALLGARCSPTQLRLIKALDPFSIVLMTDADTAGRRAADELANQMRCSGVRVSRPVTWPRGAKDPGEMSVEQRREVFMSAPDAVEIDEQIARHVWQVQQAAIA